MDKKILVKFENVEYVWQNKSWVRLLNNLRIPTALAQKLDGYALKNNLLTREDLVEKKSK